MSRLRRVAFLQPAWLITFAVAVTSVTLFVFLVRDLPTVSGGSGVPWWALAGGIALAESVVVHLHFRSESGTFSFFEIPLAVGLIFTQPGGLWVATIVGLPIALVALRKQEAIKVLFNVANLSLHVAVAAIVMHAFAPSDALEPSAWPALVAAITAGALVQIVPLAAIISLTEGVVQRRQVLTLVITAVAVSVVNTAQALIAILLVVNEPLSVVPLVVTTVFVFMAYRAYLSERANRERVEFLYSSTRALRDSPEADSAIARLLAETASTFRATRADLHILPRDGVQTGALVRYRIADETHEREDELHAGATLFCEFGMVPTLVTSPRVPEELKELFAREGLRDAMIGTLLGTSEPLAVLVVGDRLGAVTTFTRDDLKLFESLVEHAAVALENNELESALAEMHQVEQSLRHRAGHDSLTGLANRATFHERLDAHLSSRNEVAVLYLDLDDFKIVNDTLGHDAGDAVLVEVANRIVFRLTQRDLAARMGGDEFAVILVDTAPVAPSDVAKRIVSSLHESITVDGNEVHIGASIGVAVASTGIDTQRVIRHADTAMYQAKRNGKGSVVEFSSDMLDDANESPGLKTQLRLAVNRNEFELAYQPIVELSSGTIVGAEAFVRWRANGELLRPARFLAEAELTGLIIPIDQTVLTMAVDEIAQMVDTDPFFVSVNLSPRSFESGELTEKIAALLEGRHVSPDRLVIEIATASMPDLVGFVDEISRLRTLGVRVALEDFGTLDYSLSQLRMIPFDIAKVRVGDVGGSASEAFVRGLAAFSQAAGRKVIAVDIEEAPQLARATSAGFDFGQGYLLGRPSTAADLAERFESPSVFRRAS